MAEPSVCEEKNFQTLFENHLDDVRNFMYYKTGDKETADDLAQESFIKMWDNCSKVIFSKAKSYLFTIANRLFLNTVRHDKIRLTFAKKNPTKDIVENPEFVLEGEEFKQKLEDAISALPEKQRVAFLLNRIDKMTYNQIAEHLEVSVKTVEKRIGDALSTLKEKVEELNMYKI